MKKRILIIDDDIQLCEEFQDILVAEGFCVNIVHNGLSGKKILENEVFDILLLDIKIPGLSGFEILKWLKDNHYQLRIIILTGRPLYRAGYITDKNDVEEILLDYADEVINKPSTIENIINKIKHYQ
ncbi:MAG: response regulator [Spirochaetales bacterium]|nr:response regulator [Spirochaetales bacterium]